MSRLHLLVSTNCTSQSNFYHSALNASMQIPQPADQSKVNALFKSYKHYCLFALCNLSHESWSQVVLEPQEGVTRPHPRRSQHVELEPREEVLLGSKEGVAVRTLKYQTSSRF